MLRFQIPEVVWGILFGIFVTIVLVGSTLKYLLPPLEMFGDDTADCRQPAIHSNEKAKAGKGSAKDNTAILQDTQPGDHEDEPDGKKHEYECLIAKYTGSLAAFTRWLVIATLLLALFGFWQVIVSRDTTRRQLRAYVSPVKASITNLSAGHFQEFRIIIKNSGQTPAYKLRHIAGVKYTSFPLNEPLQIDAIPDIFSASLVNIGPGGKLQKSERATNPLSTLAINDLGAGRTAIYVYGELSFVDAFKKSRWLRYRLMTGGNVGFRVDGLLANCEEGNETSED